MSAANQSEGHRKIAIRVGNWIGDVVMSLPALEIVRAHHPEAEIVAIGRPWIADLLGFRRDLVDRCIVAEDRRLLRHPLAFWRYCGNLRSERFNWGIAFTSHLKGALALFLSRAKITAGFGTPETRLFLSSTLRRKSLPKGGRHQSQNYLDLIDSVGFFYHESPPPTLHPDPALNAEVGARYLKDAASPLLAVHAGAAYGTAKRWLPERYAAVCRNYPRDHGGSVVLLGVPVEAETNRTIREACGDRAVIDLCGRTSLRESIALISMANAFLSNDSGLMHVAAAFSIPQVAIFGPTDISATFPHNPHAETLYRQVPCSPCFRRHCPIGHDCMRAVSGEDVEAALARVLAKP